MGEAKSNSRLIVPVDQREREMRSVPLETGTGHVRSLFCTSLARMSDPPKISLRARYRSCVRNWFLHSRAYSSQLLKRQDIEVENLALVLTCIVKNYSTTATIYNNLELNPSTTQQGIVYAKHQRSYPQNIT